jgi:RimJ/RimL family protein N-acetyltransferase
MKGEATSLPGTLRGLAIAKPTARDLRSLFQRYLQASTEPFFLDIAGPELSMPLPTFVAYCREDAAMWLLRRENEVAGFFLLFDIQPGLALANLDFGWFSPLPAPRSTESENLNAALHEVCCRTGVSRVQLLALPQQEAKVALFRSWGFQAEGLLREHFWHMGKRHDLILLARLEPSRHGV